MSNKNPDSPVLDRFIRPEEFSSQHDAFEAALGRILLSMDDLRETIARTILRAVGLKQADFLAGMPFANQVDLLTVLVSRLPRDHFDPCIDSPAAEMAEFARRCHEAESLWHTFLKSGSRDDYLRRAALGIVHTPDPNGRTWTQAECDFAAAQDAADALTCVEADLSEFISCSWKGPPRDSRPVTPERVGLVAPLAAPVGGDAVAPPGQPAAPANRAAAGASRAHAGRTSEPNARRAPLRRRP